MYCKRWLCSCGVALGRTLAMDNLMKGGIIIVAWCFMCKIHGEMWLIFSYIVRWLGNCSLWLLFGWCPLGLILWWRCYHAGRDFLVRGVIGGIWKAVRLYLMWCLWKERKDCCFKYFWRSDMNAYQPLILLLCGVFGKNEKTVALNLFFFVEDLIWTHIDISYFFYCGLWIPWVVVN